MAWARVTLVRLTSVPRERSETILARSALASYMVRNV